MAARDTFRVYKDEETMLQVYNRRLSYADTRFKKHRSKDMERFVDRYRGTPTDTEVQADGHRVRVLSGVGLVDTMYSSMTAVDVEFSVRNIGHGTRMQAYAATRALNQAWADTKGQRRAKKAVKDAVIQDIGWVKVYYDYIEDVDLRDKPQDALEAEIESLGLNGASDDEIDEAISSGLLSLVEEVDVVVRDRVCVDYVDPTMVRFDTAAKNIEDMRWVAQYTQLPLPEVKESPRYKEFMAGRYGEAKAEEMLRDLSGDSSVRTGVDVGSLADLADALTPESGEDDSRLTVVEMWDLETGLVTEFPRYRQDVVLYQRPNPLMMNVDLEDRSPFKPLVVRDDPDNIEGLGDMRVAEPVLQEMEEYRGNLATYISRMIPKLIGPARGLTANGKKQLQSKQWGGLVETEEGYDGSQFKDLNPPAIPQEAFGMPDKLQVELQNGTGANEVLRGVFPEKRTTATETQLVSNAGEQRQAERRSALEYWYTDIARTMLQLMQLYYDRDRMFRYTDESGQDFEWSWNKSDIAIEADLEISLTPKENPTRQERFQQALQVMNLVLPLPDTDRGALMKWVLEEAGLSEDDIRAIIQTPEEVQGQQLQQQMQQQALAVAPQRAGSAPAGLDIQPVPRKGRG